MLFFRLVISYLVNLAILGALLFLPAGTMDWWRAWVLLGVFSLGTLATTASLANNRDLLKERLTPLAQRGQPLADKILLVCFVVAFTGLLAFIPWDVFHLHLTEKADVRVSSFGLVLVLAGWWIVTLAMKRNSFASPVVRHQEERRQAVVDTGVYGVVRHPMYAGTILFALGLPLWLESYAAAALACVPAGLLVLRILIEERFLRRELPGYADYINKVRSRLIPFVW